LEGAGFITSPKIIGLPGGFLFREVIKELEGLRKGIIRIGLPRRSF